MRRLYLDNLLYLLSDTAHGQCVNGKVRLPMNKKVSSEEEHREKSDHKYGILLESTQRECRNGDVCKGESTWFVSFICPF